MRPISKNNRDIISSDPYFATCARLSPSCAGKVTIHHAYIYAGRQIDELWNFVPLCEYHHAVNTYQDGGDFDDAEGKRLALKRATDEDLAKYPKKNWKQEKLWLNI